MTDELTAWKMRCGLMSCVQMKQSPCFRNKNLEASLQLNIMDCGVLMRKKPGTMKLSASSAPLEHQPQNANRGNDHHHEEVPRGYQVRGLPDIPRGCATIW